MGAPFVCLVLNFAFGIGLKFTGYLLTLLPFALETSPIGKVHLAIPFSQVVDKIALVDVSVFPDKDSVALLFILFVLAFIFIAISRPPLPDSLSISHPVLEVSFEETSNGPIILPIAFRFSVRIQSFVRVTICKLLNPLSMFKTILKFALISVSVDPSVDSVPECLTLLPLANIGISLRSSPNTGSMFLPINPFTFESLSVVIRIGAVAFWFSLRICAIIYGPILELLQPLLVLEIVMPISLIDPAVGVKHDSDSTPVSINDGTKVDGLPILFQLRVFRLPEFLPVDQL